MAYKSNNMGMEAINGLTTSLIIPLDTLFVGMNIDSLKEKYINGQERGNTKFPDLIIVTIFIACRFILLETSKKVGYSITNKEGKPTWAVWALTQRLRRINTTNFADVVFNMLANGLITTDDTKAIITRRVHNRPGTNKTITKGRVYRYYAKRLVVDALKLYPNMIDCANKLGVEAEDLEWWLNEDVENILVSPS